MTDTRIEIPSGDVTVVGDRYGDPADPPVVFLHGGGQTRHSWASSARDIAAAGWSTITLDLRGHGDSGWSPDGNYGLGRFADDVVAVARFLDRPPVLVGASLGGNAALSSLGDDPELAAGLVLVDVSPFTQRAGTDRVKNFMAQHAETGFAALEEAADAVAAYQPHRKRPSNLDGLRKNLRERDGRWYWHWDPAFLRDIGAEAVQRDRHLDPVHLGAAAASLRIPTLLVRGGESDVISIEDSARFLRVVPHAEFASVGGAHHMVAGDDNAVFEDVLVDFLHRRIRNRLNVFTEAGAGATSAIGAQNAR
ncbi:MAG: alpha/beta hydrolase [Gordonia sp. (in: high G+C Gram-positive bacteria)]|uniref:alpha/beta fold hydrolase n=1 Tax=Gordonia sp. (in: high G+C Gram-positive bacteria) TaxID=84139 RepID=UPI0039E500DD